MMQLKSKVSQLLCLETMGSEYKEVKLFPRSTGNLSVEKSSGTPMTATVISKVPRWKEIDVQLGRHVLEVDHWLPRLEMRLRT